MSKAYLASASTASWPRDRRASPDRGSRRRFAPKGFDNDLAIDIVIAGRSSRLHPQASASSYSHLRASAYSSGFPANAMSPPTKIAPMGPSVAVRSRSSCTAGFERACPDPFPKYTQGNENGYRIGEGSAFLRPQGSTLTCLNLPTKRRPNHTL